VERLNDGIASWLEEADRSLRWDGTSVTRVSEVEKLTAVDNYRCHRSPTDFVASVES